jgi:hypothetical protein
MNRSRQGRSRENHPKILSSDIRQEIGVPSVLLFAFTEKRNGAAEK